MANYTDYFRRTAHRPRYLLGDRVWGRWNRIPFIGTVAIESAASGGPARVLVMVDLPILLQGQTHNLVSVDPKSLKLLVKF